MTEIRKEQFEKITRASLDFFLSIQVFYGDYVISDIQDRLNEFMFPDAWHKKNISDCIGAHLRHHQDYTVNEMIKILYEFLNKVKLM